MRGLILVWMSNVCYLAVILIVLVVTWRLLLVTWWLLVVTARYWWLLLVIARYCSFPLLVWTVILRIFQAKLLIYCQSTLFHMSFDNFLTPCRFFVVERTPGTSETTCTKVCKVNLMSCEGHVWRNTRDFLIFCEFFGWNLFNSPQNGTSDGTLREIYVRNKLKIIINKQWIIDIFYKE